jgi:glyoxylase-like metal-dependent hydrolase (beta-lactamase superfamily II)
VTPRRFEVPAETCAPTGRTAAYLLGRLLVDPGGQSDSLDRAVREAGVEHVAVTHHHPDHVGAVAGYARRFDLTVWARAGRTGAFAAAAGIDPDRTFRPGSVFPAGDGGVTVLDTPGHAPEHVGFGCPAGVVSGDLAVAEGSVVVGAPEGDMRAYLTSLRRVHAMGPRRLFPAHGPVIEDPRATCERLLAHRLDRERRVLAAVRDGAREVGDLLERAYGKDLTGVRDLARATVRAHLEKLAVEGRVAWDGERVRPA